MSIKYVFEYFYYISKIIFFSFLVLYPLLWIILPKHIYLKYEYLTNITILVWLIFILPLLWCLCKIEKPQESDIESDIEIGIII